MLGTRGLLADIAHREAARHAEGDEHQAGQAIERYLAVFRTALNQNGATTKYSDLAVGFHWCGAFVYYCCLEAGFRLTPKPMEGARYTLAVVSSWQQWAMAGGYYLAGDQAPAQRGDIALYNGVYDGRPLDHLGVVIGVVSDGILSAEGNNANRTGVFHRPFSVIDGYVRLPE